MKSARKASDSNLDFDGMTGDGVNRAGSRHSGNHWGGVQNPNKLINEGRGPTKGNQDYDAMQGAHREPPYSKRDKVEFPKNIDSINIGSQYRGVGGSTVKKPSAEARINVGRGPTKGNQQ